VRLVPAVSAVPAVVLLLVLAVPLALAVAIRQQPQRPSIFPAAAAAAAAAILLRLAVMAQILECGSSMPPAARPRLAAVAVPVLVRCLGRAAPGAMVRRQLALLAMSRPRRSALEMAVAVAVEEMRLAVQELSVLRF
jgi:hypothetical protein